MSDLWKYEVSLTSGFCLETEPVSDLPGLEQHKSLLQSPSFDLVQASNLPMLTDISSLSQAQLEFAWTTFTMLNSKFYSFSDPPNNRIPACLAFPTIQLSQLLDRPPNKDYVSCVANNWKWIDPNGKFHPDNLDVIYNMSGTRDESHFLNYHNYIDRIAAPAVVAIYEIEKYFEDKEMFREKLEVIMNGMRLIRGGLKGLTENVNQNIFFERILKYFCEFKDVVFEGPNQYFDKLMGPSAAQNSTIKLIDSFLGTPTKCAHIDDIERCMKIKHRELIREIRGRDRGKLIKAVKEHQCEEIWNEIVRELCDFRIDHIQAVQKYFQLSSELTYEDNPDMAQLLDFLRWVRTTTEQLLL
jgi:hypothetical protein